MDIRQIDWTQTIPVRHRVLWPDKPPKFCYVEGDEDGLHFGAFENDELVCVASVYIDGDTARLRKYATEIQFQGLGIGTAVLKEVIAYLKMHHINYFWCDARESALCFYERFGMFSHGERFYKSDLAYYKMGMHLCPAEDR